MVTLLRISKSFSVSPRTVLLVMFDLRNFISEKRTRRNIEDKWKKDSSCKTFEKFRTLMLLLEFSRNFMFTTARSYVGQIDHFHIIYVVRDRICTQHRPSSPILTGTVDDLPWRARTNLWNLRYAYSWSDSECSRCSALPPEYTLKIVPLQVHAVSMVCEKELRLGNYRRRSFALPNINSLAFIDFFQFF